MVEGGAPAYMTFGRRVCFWLVLLRGGRRCPSLYDFFCSRSFLRVVVGGGGGDGGYSFNVIYLVEKKK